ncbi:MAG: ATP-binding protein [Desulfobulbaceae bacterium]|nr:ATP-binding protein [Pseudomonadota bacterium]MCG2746993.1 ATP-binding protein [Desulfobulbaceae bacterium]
MSDWRGSVGAPKLTELITEQARTASWQSRDVNLKKIVFACMGQLLFAGSAIKPENHEQQFLYKYYHGLRHIDNWEQLLSRYIKNPVPEDEKLIDLATQLDLTNIEMLATVLALAVEEDPMAGRVVAYIQSPMGGSRPTLGLIESTFAALVAKQRTSWIAAAIISGKAVATGVLTILNENAPLPEQAFKIPNALALALHYPEGQGDTHTSQVCNDDITLPDSIIESAKQQARSLAHIANSVLVIRSASKKEVRTLARTVTRQLEKQPFFCQPDSVELQWLAPLCVIRQLIPVFAYDLAPGEQKNVPNLPGYNGPRIVIMGLDGNIDVHSGSVLNWTVPVPSKDERKKLWEIYLGDADMANYLADNHVHSAGRIRDLAHLAFREARLHRRSTPSMDDVQQAAWSAEEGALGSLAQPIAARIPDEAVVLPKRVREELHDLLARCRHRETLAESLGITIKARYQMGVRTLFIGPSGTGKTLVAGWLATRLGLPLYRVDLASVVSKYIGETEKNLAILLAKAEQAEIVLLFDEADSLFGKRTEIKDSNDRFANSQTNYLLQRIEFYKGIVLLTSNSRGRFDAAFTRRLDKIIDFPLPGPEERRALWLTHLGEAHDLSIKQLNQLAVVSDLAGGHIRNAVLTGAVRAHAETRPINFNDVLAGLVGEYGKVGRQLPAEFVQYQRNKT